MKKLWIAFLVTSFASAGLYAQPVRGLTTGKKIRIAEEQMALNNIYNALEWYQKAYDDDNSNLVVISEIADIHNQLRDYKEAEKWYNRLVRKDKSNQYKLARFKLAQIMKKNGNYDLAIPEFQTFIAESTDDKYKTLAANEILGAEIARELGETAGLIEVKNAGPSVNSPSTEMSPIYANDQEFYFAAIPATEITLTEEAGYAKIFKSSKNPDGTWGEGVPLTSNVNTGHTVHFTLSPDASTIYFTRCEMEGNFPSKCDLYSSANLGESQWELAKKIEGINDGTSSSKQPTLGVVNNQDAIIFVSDRAGGYGGLDIYYAVKNRNGSFDAPVNAGSAVNTVGEEKSPFFHNGMLYFSSDGHPTVGGFDVFSAKWQGSGWGEVENMGFGVNSSVDDLDYSVDKSGRNGFVISNRPGTISLKSETCCDDIFSLTYYMPLNIVALTFDKESREDLDGTTVKFIKIVNGKRVLVDTKTNPVSNDFEFVDVDRSVNYILVGSKDGFFSDSVTVATADLSNLTETTAKLLLKRIPPPPPPVVEDKYIIIQLDTIYYDFDKFNIRPDASVILDDISQTLLEFPNLKVEVASHTDALGTNEYNDILAKNRTNSAVEYLSARGVPKSQLSPMAYGELRPIAPNLKPNGMDDPVGRQKNRRTEFRIIEGADPSGKIKIPAGKTTTKPTGDASPPPPIEEIFKNGVAEMSFAQSVVDFGKIKEGEKKTHVFTFRNSGAVDLLIEFASGSCGCTVPEWPEKPIPPGGTGKITVEYDSKGKSGIQDQEINIIANTDPIVTELKIKVEVEENN